MLLQPQHYAVALRTRARIRAWSFLNGRSTRRSTVRGPHTLTFERLEDRILLSGFDPLGCFAYGDPADLPLDPAGGDPAEPIDGNGDDVLTDDMLFFTGEPQDYVGWIGDVNGDGFGDYVVGSYGASDAWIVFGDDSGELPNLEVALQQGVRLSGVAASSVLSLGDLNGDGLEDLLIHRADEAAGNTVNATYVVFGSAEGYSGGIDLAALDGTNGFEVQTGDAGSDASVGFSSVGDLNGDGLGDLLLTTWSADPSGENWTTRNYVVFGQAAGFAPVLNLSALNGQNGLEVIAPQDASLSIAAAGDVNHDGLADLLITTTAYSPVDGSVTADICVLFGQAHGFSAAVDAAAVSGLTGLRLQLSGYTSVFASAAGDINGDGIDDLVISAAGPVLDPNVWSGSDIVVFGRAGGLPTDINLAALTPDQGYRTDWSYEVPQYDYGMANLGGAADSPGFARGGEQGAPGWQTAAAYSLGLAGGATNAPFDWNTLPGGNDWSGEDADEPITGSTGRRKPAVIPLG